MSRNRPVISVHGGVLPLFRDNLQWGEESVEEVFVNQVLQERISSFYPTLTNKGITPNIAITDKHIMRAVSRSNSRIFSNLLNNAVKYSYGDLEVTLSDTGEIRFSYTAKNCPPFR